MAITISTLNNKRNGRLKNGFEHEGRKENVFNDAFNTFQLRLYGVRHIVKDHSDTERGNPLPPYRLLFPISSKDLLYASFHRKYNTYLVLCYTSRGALA